MSEKMTMQDYILQTPETLRTNIQNRAALTREIKSLIQDNQPDEIWLIASGSSNNACQIALPYLNTKWNVRLMTPFHFVHHEKAVDKVLPLFISQSGLSTNTIEALTTAKKRNMPAIAVTGNPEADIKDVSDIVLDYGVGEELVGYVTKGVGALAIYLILAAMENDEDLDALNAAVDSYEDVIKRTPAFIQDNYKGFSSMPWMYICGSGSSMGAVSEGALKIGETIHIPSAGYEVEEFIHGPNLQLTPEYPILFIDSNDSASSRIHQIYQASRKVSDKVWLLSEKADRNDPQQFSVNETDPVFASIPALGFVQWLSAEISKDLHSTIQHPLLKEFKKTVSAKTENFVNYDEDEA